MRNENRLEKLSDSIKHNNIHIIGVLKKRREMGTENLFEEIIAENFPNLVTETDIQIQEAENSHQNQQWQIHTKTYCNQI